MLEPPEHKRQRGLTGSPWHTTPKQVLGQASPSLLWPQTTLMSPELTLDGLASTGTEVCAGTPTLQMNVGSERESSHCPAGALTNYALTLSSPPYGFIAAVTAQETQVGGSSHNQAWWSGLAIPAILEAKAGGWKF